MRVLTIGSDPSLFLERSPSRARMQLYATALEELHIVVPTVRKTDAIQEGNLFIHPIRTNRLFRVLALAQKAHTLIRERSIDVVSAQDPFLYGLAALRAVRGTRARVNIQVHTDLAALSIARRMLAGFVLRRAESIRVVSNKIKDYLLPFRLTAPISVLPVYMDLAPFRSVMHRPHPHFKKTILWIGRFEKEKDPLMALTILEDVRRAGIDAGLILLGAGSLERDLSARAAPLAPYVEFAGWEDPKPYLAMADVVLSTSLHESYGMSIVEALAAGVLVVAPDIGIAKDAGAIIATRENLAEKVVDVLGNDTRGELKFSVLTSAEWLEKWKHSLL
jgi:glycosyltransferase involved in cell wall biosynthesis